MNRITFDIFRIIAGICVVLSSFSIIPYNKIAIYVLTGFVLFGLGIAAIIEAIEKIKKQ